MPTTQVANGRAFTYLYSLGCVATAGKGFSHPIGVARGSGDTLYVASWGDEFFVPRSRVTKCTLSQEWILDMGGTSIGDGQFVCPGGLALDSDDTIYVTDQSINKIVIFDKDGTFLGRWGVHGSGDGEFDRPSGIVFDEEDNLYVVDTFNHRVQKFTKQGEFLLAWGTEGNNEGQLNLPWGIAIDAHGDVYVADWANDRIQKFTKDGEFLATFGKSGNGKGELSRPSGVALDKDGDVYVADWGNNRVQVYGPDGGYLVTLVGDATDLSKWAASMINANPDYLKARARANLEPEWRFRRPVALVVDDDYRVFIAETRNNRVQVYQKDIRYEDPQFNL